MGGAIISELGGGIIPLQGGGIIPELGGGFPRNQHCTGEAQDADRIADRVCAKQRLQCHIGSLQFFNAPDAFIESEIQLGPSAGCVSSLDDDARAQSFLVQRYHGN